MQPAETSKFDMQHLNRELDRCKSAVFLGKTAAFLGSIMCSLNFVWTQEIPTAETNGIDLWWNPTWFLGMTPDNRKAVLMHELWHVARLHMLRLGDRCPDVWNYACDYVINNDLKDEGYVFDGIGGLFDPQYVGMAEEDVYDLLQKNGGGGPFPGAFNGKGGHDIIPLKPEEKHQVINKVVTAVHQAKLAGAGNVPGAIESILDHFLAPVIPWQTVLNRFFTQLLDENYTWARPNRRYLGGTDMYLPSRFTDDGRLENLRYYLDVSGSISDADVVRFNSELKFVKETFNPEKLSMVQFDTRIQKIDVFGPDDTFDKLVVVGRGGTSLECVRRDMLEEQPTAAIIFTDMQCKAMLPLDLDIPVIWIVTGTGGHKPAFGEVINIRG
jgi:predicted metal-dependent peptidase